ncbi:MAG: threonine--tRNA ligase [Candidatus Aenigmarchaeota archaeon]|nr:threonine--tRNA ligase [Candidatus Aenigmarchaeota archaeon]
MVKITLPDGSVQDKKDGITPAEIAKEIGEGLFRAALAAKVNDVLVNLNEPISSDSKIEIITFKQDDGKKIYWHSTSHVMAAAVRKLYPEAKFGIGPAIEEGFYYDFDNLKISETDLEKIEEEMKSIIKQDLKFEKKNISKKEANSIFKNQPFKLELIKNIEEETVSVYSIGNFVDLCKGPHVSSSGKLESIKLLKFSGAYWMGNSKNPMLQRIYGISFPSGKDLKSYLKMREEAEQRDHSKLGRDLDLYITHPAVGKGLPLFTPKGTTMLMILQRWVEDEEIKRGYQYTKTPVMAKTDLYKISGHLDHYRENMFIFKTDEDEEVSLRPMTCPFQFMIYKSKSRSYRDLPIKYTETSPLFRKELSGELHGLIRVWQFTLADGHIICLPEQLEEEFEKALELVQYIMNTLGFDDYWYRFSKWDPKNKEKYIDNPEAWEKSQKIMKKIIDKMGLNYVEAENEAAFYGPKLDVQMKNVWGKEDTMFTVQIDFALPERFDMKYIDKNNEEKRPMVIHRSSIGCYERTLAFLIEKYAGNFPLWLSPTQVRILTVSEKTVEFAEKVNKLMKENGIRSELDYSSNTLEYKVRNAELEKIPYTITIGEKEEQNNTLAVRPRSGKVKFGVKTENFIEDILKEIKEKK